MFAPVFVTVFPVLFKFLRYLREISFFFLSCSYVMQIAGVVHHRSAKETLADFLCPY